MDDIFSSSRNDASARQYYEEKIEEAKNQLAQIESIDVAPDLRFPLMESALVEMQINLSQVSTRLWEISRCKEDIDKAKRTKEWISSYASYLDSKLRYAMFQCKTERFDEAITALKNIKIPSELLSFRFASIFYELKQWLIAKIYKEKAEWMNSHSKCPLSDNEFTLFKEAVERLPIGVHSKSDFARMQDYLVGLSFLRESYLLDNKKLTPEKMVQLGQDIQRLEYSGMNSSSLTRWRHHVLRYRLLRSYNEACVEYFDTHPEYRDALTLFHYKHLFDAAELNHPAYTDSESDEEFRIAFLREDILRKNGNDFFEVAASISSTITSCDDIPCITIATVLTSSYLKDNQRASLLKVISGLTFTKRVYIFVAAKKIGVDDKNEEELFGLLEGNKQHRYADLEKVAKPLLYIRKNINPKFSERLENVIDSLFRSPKSIKIAVKTPMNEVRDLSKKGYKNPPVGSKYVSTPIKGHGKFYYGFTWFLAIVIPLAIAAVASALIYLYCPAGGQPYAYLAPPIFLEISFLTIVSMHCGRDERGSAYARRILGFIFIALAIFTLFYYIFPSELSAFATFGYTLIIGTAVMAFTSMMTLKDFNRRFGFWTYWPVAVILSAALVFLIIDMMNGLI